MDTSGAERLKKRRDGVKVARKYPTNKYSGNDGKWRTPQHSAKAVARVEKGAALDVGFEGIWVTCARGAEKKAMAELTTVCAQYGQQMWPLSLSDDPAQLSRQSELSKGDPDSLDDVPSTDGEFDIEASISREIQSMKSSGVSTAASSLRQTRMFTPIRSAMECVFFMRTKPPIIPLDLTMRICIESRHSRDGRLERMCRYVNRITPVATMDKATANGVARVARRVLAPYFDLTADSAASELEQNTTQREETQEAPIVESRSIETGSRRQCGNHLDKGAPTDVAEHTYAIRPTIRHHNNFSSEAVIKLVAGIVGPRHRVDLKRPDKVILVEIYQLLCGMEVVDGPTYKDLKRFNVNEIHKAASDFPTPEEAGVDAPHSDKMAGLWSPSVSTS